MSLLESEKVQREFVEAEEKVKGKAESRKRAARVEEKKGLQQAESRRAVVLLGG